MKTLKHLFVALLLLLSVAVNAHDFEVNGIYYNITDADNKTVEVTYKGSNFRAEPDEYIDGVVIPESVTYKGNSYKITSIGISAFRGCTGLTSIIIPNSLASIGDYAFYDCSGLDSVVIPNSVTSIGYSAFDGCIGLVSVEIGNGITNFGNFAFAYCSSLVNITSRIPANSIFAVNTKVFDGVDKTASTLYVPYGAKETYASTAGWSEFANIVELEPEIITGGSCGKNVTWTLVDDVLTISGSGAMDDSFNISVPWEEYRDVIHTVIIEEGVTSIGFAAFHDYSGLTSVIIGNSVTSIGGQAFENCTGLTSVVIPNSVTSIGGAAFRACSGLTSIEIPNSVTSIGDEAFHACPGLTSVTIGNSVTSIGNYAFRACSGLTSIEIPNSVTIIEPQVFAYCAGLTRIKVESGNTKYDSREDCNAIIETATNTLIVGCKTTKIPAGVTSIGEAAFSECNSLTSIEIPNSVTSIGDYAFFDCSGLDSVVIPNSVTSIGNQAFVRCFGLTSVTIGNSVTSIGSQAFSACSGLASITSLIPADKLFTVGTSVFGHVDKTYCTLYVPYGAKEAYASTAGWSEFANIVELEPEIITGGNCGENVTWTFEDGVLTISGSGEMYDYSFDHKPWRDYNILDLVIEQGVTRIGDSAFNGFWGLPSIVIPDNVTSIGNCAFELSDNIKSVTIGKGVTSIGVGAFASCNGITRFVIDSGNPVYDSRDNCNAIIETATNTLIQGFNSTIIPNSVTSIGDFSFVQCVILTDIVIPVGVTSIGESAFLNCYGLTSVVIPNSVTSIGNLAFSACSGLTKIEIPNSVTCIGNSAFSDCHGLTSVVIPNSVTSIGNDAFCFCNKLTSITSLIPVDKLFAVNAFELVDKNVCTLYVPYGAKETYASTAGWNEFANIVELEPETTEVTITINQYGAATYCSPYALDFGEVEGLKAYSAIGFNSGTQVVTLARVMTTPAEAGIFVKGEPGEYVVPVIEECNEHTLNLLVGTLEQTTVNSTDGEMSNYKFTVAELDEVPMFYPFEDNTAFSAGKAYLQIPTVWLPATAQKSVSVRFDEGETTDIEEPKGENGEVKTIYDLQGRVVENPASGIYIIDGKKVIIK